MADRFPSLEEFDSGAQTEAQGDLMGDDFLSREKAILGDDANQFSTGNDHAAFVEEGDNDLLGGGGDDNEEVTEFESSFPAMDSLTLNEGVAPGGSITNTSSAPYQSSYQPTVTEEEEPEPIRLWRERRQAEIAEREARSAERKAETIKNAQENVDEFYGNYNTKKEKTIAASRRDAEEFLAAREDTSAGGTSWDRIAKLVDLSGKGVKGGASGSEKAKFRDLLTSLRKDEKAPGATGY